MREKGKAMRNAMAILAMVVAIVLSNLTVAEAGCNVALCTGGRPAPSVTFQGSGQIERPIEVQVCHGYWDRLAGPDRWWNVTIRYGGWERDLPVVRRECKTYWVRPGTDMRLYASCVNRVIGTGPMTHSGRYTMR